MSIVSLLSPACFFISNFSIAIGILLLLFAFFICLITHSFISDYMNRKNGSHIFSSMLPFIGFIFVIFSFIPLFLIPLNQFGLLKSIFSRNLSKSILILDSAFINRGIVGTEKYFDYFVLTISHATLNSYWISLIAVVVSFSGIISAIVLACGSRSEAHVRFLRASKIKRMFEFLNEIFDFCFKAMESIPRILLLCILLPPVCLLFNKSLNFHNNIHVFTGLIIGLSCMSLPHRLAADRISHMQGAYYIVNSRIHGVSNWKIIWYHTIWKNCTGLLLTELIYIWGLAMVLDTGLNILFARGEIDIQIIDNLAFSLGRFLTSESIRNHLVQIGTNSIFANPFEILKVISPFGLILLTTSGLFFMQRGFLNEKENELRQVQEEDMCFLDRLLMGNWLKQSNSIHRWKRMFSFWKNRKTG